MLEVEHMKQKAEMISSVIGRMELDHPIHMEENWHGWLAFFNGMHDAIFEAQASLHSSMLDHLNADEAHKRGG